jgi:hypothetical protein
VLLDSGFNLARAVWASEKKTIACSLAMLFCEEEFSQSLLVQITEFESGIA